MSQKKGEVSNDSDRETEASRWTLSPETMADGPSLDVGALMGGRREVVLLHEGARYRLRVTASNKLILTK
jgi:hemin uptake protein HemP